MGLSIMERSFPRGGRETSSAPVDKAAKKKKINDLFANKPAQKTKPKKTKDKVNKKPSRGVTDIPKASSVDPLSYKLLSEGMLVLGCIGEVRQYDMWVSLPGRIVGRVPITAISTQYTNALQALAEGADQVKSLGEMFSVGQHVVTKVTELSVDGDRTNVTLSLMPHEIHSELSHSVLKKGMVLTGALSSIEDHGYLIDFGIKSLRTFLKKKDAKDYISTINKGTPLGVGQLIRCLVTKVSSSSSSSTAEVTADPQEVEAALVPAQARVNPHLVLPGMRFGATVSQVLHDGLQIKWQTFEGFVHRDHLPDPCKAPDKQITLTDAAVEATVLYSLPIVRSVHFSLQDPPPFSTLRLDPVLASQGVPSTSTIQLGQTVNSAEVVSASWRGISLKLNKLGARGFVSINQVADHGDAPEDMRTKFPASTRLTCRVLRYDPMDQVYICTMQKSLLSEKLLVVGDAKPGMIVQCRIIEIKKAGLLVQIGKNPQLRALVPTLHVADTVVSDLSKRFQVGQQVRGKVYKAAQEKRQLHITLKPSLVQSDRPILASYDNVPSNTWFDGTVVWIGPSFYLVSFYNDVAGKLHRQDVPGEIGSAFSVGQVISCRVLEADSKSAKLKLSMLPVEEDQSTVEEVEIGKEYSVKVLQISSEGLHVKIKGKKGGFAVIPTAQVSDHDSLAMALTKCYQPGYTMKAVCVTKDKPLPIFTASTAMIEALANSARDWRVNSLLPCIVNGVTKNGVLVNVCNDDPNTLAYVPLKFLADEPVEKPEEIFHKGQSLICRVMSLRTEEEASASFQAIVSTKLRDTWSGNSMAGLSLLESYLARMGQIFEHLKLNGDPLCKLVPGQMVTGTVTKTTKDFSLVQLEDGVVAYISPYHSQGMKLEQGQEVRGLVLWLDVAQKRVEMSLRTEVLKHVSRNQALGTQLEVDSTQRGEVLLTNENFILMALKGKFKGQIVFSPSKRHINDLKPPSHIPGEIMKLVVTKVNPCFIICASKKEMSLKKVEIKSPTTATEPVREIKDTEVPQASSTPQTLAAPATKKKRKANKTKDFNAKRVKRSSGKQKDLETERLILDAPEEAAVTEQLCIEVPKPARIVRDETALPRLEVEGGFMWDVPTQRDEAMDSSSDESDEETMPKKRLTLAEKREMARKEEERLIQTEQRLMDEERTPQTADDFDRLVMASPDSSIIWVQYMAFHLQATEIEKARVVARKALKTISFREEQEKLNVWVALLNLENLYGTQESLEKTLQEAVQLNDAFKVYSQMLQIFTDTLKIEEGDALFETMLRKFRSEKEVWIQGGTFYLSTGQLEKARNVLQRALRSLETKHHVDVICRFAFLENRFGSAERSHTLFEHVLSSFPKRVDVWCSYVDLLIKSDNLDAARQVLERGVAQKGIPVRKVKVLFKKFLDFEEQYGTEEGVETVRTMAQEYVKSITAGLPEASTK